MKSIIVDLDRCNGCFNCQIACKDEHCDNDWRPIAAPQPMTGQFWCKVDQKERGRVPVVSVDYTPTFCGMCDNAECMNAVSDGSVYRREDGLVLIDPEKARGHRELVDACPLGMIYYNEALDLPQKCTGCAHLLDDGWEAPRCVDACATGALRYGDVEDFADELDDAQVAEALGGKGSHVLYINRPAERFIAGTVADREANEVLIGAKVQILDESGNQVASLETDEFGDFKYEGSVKSCCKVSIEAEGYEPAALDADTTADDVVFDDVFMKSLA